MEQTIKPIETVYNGYRFRSRLEARWAVFFDAAGIKYQYEPEGFEMQDGTRYLPDFYLPDDDMYVETKSMKDGFEQEIRKALKVITECRKTILVLTEMPYLENNNVWWFPVFFNHPVSKEIEGFRITFFVGDDEKLHFVTDWRVGRDSLLGAGFLCVNNYKLKKHQLEDFVPKNDIELCNGEFAPRNSLQCDFLDSCYIKARQARFEHGETPKVRKGA